MMMRFGDVRQQVGNRLVRLRRGVVGMVEAAGVERREGRVLRQEERQWGQLSLHQDGREKSRAVQRRNNRRQPECPSTTRSLPPQEEEWEQDSRPGRAETSVKTEPRLQVQPALFQTQPGTPVPPCFCVKCNDAMIVNNFARNKSVVDGWRVGGLYQYVADSVRR